MWDVSGACVWGTMLTRFMRWCCSSCGQYLEINFFTFLFSYKRRVLYCTWKKVCKIVPFERWWGPISMFFLTRQPIMVPVNPLKAPSNMVVVSLRISIPINLAWSSSLYHFRPRITLHLFSTDTFFNLVSIYFGSMTILLTSLLRDCFNLEYQQDHLVMLRPTQVLTSL